MTWFLSLSYASFTPYYPASLTPGRPSYSLSSSHNRLVPLVSRSRSRLVCTFHFFLASPLTQAWQSPSYGCFFSLAPAYTTSQGFLAFFAPSILHALSCVSAEPSVFPTDTSIRSQTLCARKAMTHSRAFCWLLLVARHFSPSKIRHLLLCATHLVCLLSSIALDSSTCSQFRYGDSQVMRRL